MNLSPLGAVSSNRDEILVEVAPVRLRSLQHTRHEARTKRPFEGNG